MAYSSIEITFDSMPAINSFLEFNETTNGYNVKETFKVNRTAIKQTKVPAGFNAGTEEAPLIIYSGFIPTNYETAFNLDYNSGIGEFFTYVTNGPDGSGLGKILIVAGFANAVFEEVNTPAGISVVIDNQIEEPVIGIVSAVASANAETPCSVVDVTVSTSLLATEILSPVAVNPNTDNPFVFQWARGETINITVKDVDGNEATQPLTTPPVLDETLFTFGVVDSFEGATVTVNNSLPPGLTLEYSIDGVTFQSSNVFTGVGTGLQTIIVRDNYGCAIAKSFTVAGLPVPVILSRSPYFCVIAPGVDFDSATMDLRVWRGNVIADYPATPTQPFSKSVVQAGQSEIIFNISKVVNDYTKNKYSHNPAGVGAFTSPLLDSVWVETDSKAFFNGDQVGNEKRRYLALDGFGLHTEGYNPAVGVNVLSSINRHIYYGNNYPIYFLTKDLTAININGSSVPFTFSQNNSNQLVGFVNVAAYAGVSTAFTAVFTYGATVITHYFTKKTECKYPVYNCYFKNKFGVWQSIAFNKLSKGGLDVQSSEFEGNVLNGNGSYDLNAHVTRTYSVEGKRKITVNTDNDLPETYYNLFEELHLSEMVYLENAGLCLPVNFARKNLDRKTKVKDRLIQYSEEFTYSFNALNSVM